MKRNAQAPQPQASRLTFRFITSLLAPWKSLLAIIGLLVILSAVLELATPMMTRVLVDGHLARGNANGLLNIALLFLTAAALKQAIEFGKNYLTAIASQGALHDLRVRLFAHLQGLPMPYFDKTPLGDSISRCTADVETLDTLFSSGVVSVVTDMARLVTVSVAMIVMSPLLTGISALVIVPVIFITNVFRIRIREAERVNRRAVGLLNTQLQEILGGAEVIRAFGRQEMFVARFRGALRKVIASFNRATGCDAAYTPTMALLSASTIAALLWSVTTPAFKSWGISIGTFIAFIQLFKRFFDPINAIGDDWQTVQSALSGAERIFQVMLTPAANADVNKPQAENAKEDDAVVGLRDVIFGYLPERPVLHSVSMNVRPGEHVALVGRTGAGKSSMLHLVGGLYSCWSGDVRIAGCDPRQMDEAQRRRVLGVVPQKVQLFSGTVIDNLTLGDTAISREAAQRAAVIAGADSFIQTLPQAYDTPLSDLGRGKGTQLSAGQRQLLALARALVWDPSVVLLDEATAAIDHASEAAFREALRDKVLSRGHAVITVAHRLATAREADRIVVLERGRILEEGTPDDLIRCGGHFAAWLELEAAGWDWHSEA